MALSVQIWAIPIEMSGFRRETTTSERQHVFLKSFNLHLLCVVGIKHSHRYPKISNIYDYILHIKCTRGIIFEQNNPATEKSIKPVPKLDKTWRVVIISPTMYVVKFKGGYDKYQ